MAQPKVGSCSASCCVPFLDTHTTFARCFSAAALAQVAPSLSVPGLADKLVQNTSAWLLPSLGYMIILLMTSIRPAILSAAGRPAVWTSRHREDPAGTGCGPPHRLHLHPGFWVGAGAEVHWRGVAHGPRAVRHGQVGLLPGVTMTSIGFFDLHALQCKQCFGAMCQW